MERLTIATYQGQAVFVVEIDETSSAASLKCYPNGIEGEFHEIDRPDWLRQIVKALRQALKEAS